MADETGDHLDPTQEISLQGVKTRAIKGVVLLTGRTFSLSVLSLIATGFLTVFLEPSEFGVFWIVSAVVNFLAYFSDIGLAAALIQKKDRPSSDDLKTTFVIQQLLVFGLLLLLILLGPFLSNAYSLSAEGKFLLYALGLSLLFSSLKTIPSVLLERELEFEKLVIPQVLENLVYNVSAVFLAWRGLGISSFTYAVLFRGLVGLVAIYILKPWVPGISFSRGSLKKLLSYGLPYQANTLIATLKDDGMTAVLGSILGFQGVGFLGWAQKWGQAPLRFFMDHVIKVTFPAFARMQDEKEQLTYAVTRSIFFVCILVFPMLVGRFSLWPILIEVIPRYIKWKPALLPLFLIGINTAFAAVTTPLTNLLNAIGKIKITFKWMIMWTALTWVFVPLLSLKYGVSGAALGYAIVGVSSIIAIYIVRNFVRFSLTESALKPLIAAFLMGVAVLVLRSFLPTSILSVWVLILAGTAIYSTVIYLLVGKPLISDVKKSFETFFSKHDRDK